MTCCFTAIVDFMQQLSTTAERHTDLSMTTSFIYCLCEFSFHFYNNFQFVIVRRSMNDFNHGVVLTSRTLKSNEMFEIRLDKIVKKWAGSIEIGTGF
jgi:hypothetical protein